MPMRHGNEAAEPILIKVGHKIEISGEQGMWSHQGPTQTLHYTVTIQTTFFVPVQKG